MWRILIFLGISVQLISANYYYENNNNNRRYYSQQDDQQGQGQGYYRHRPLPVQVKRDRGSSPSSTPTQQDYQQQQQWWANLQRQQEIQQQRRPTATAPRRGHYGQTGNIDERPIARTFDSSGSNNVPRWSTNQNGNNGRRTNELRPQPAPMSMDGNGRVKMGVANSMCDDAKTNLTVDWDMSPVNHTCYHPETRFPVDTFLPTLYQCDRLSPRYVPGHVCMDGKIPYDDDIPTHGDHRPLWPMFGEYIFVPRERWLHNIEHGAIVMLYHPCAHPEEVNKLKRIVKSCVGKHVITPSTLLSPDRPLALVAWGCRLVMSRADEESAISFIQRRAHKGPEGTYTKEGQFTFGLLQKATMSGNGAVFGYSRVECV